VTHFYREVAEPLLLRNVNLWHNNESDHPTLLGFYRAFSLVSSRAFLVDAYHGLAMVPIADAYVIHRLPAGFPTITVQTFRFNHVRENHVHLEVIIFDLSTRYILIYLSRVITMSVLNVGLSKNAPMTEMRAQVTQSSGYPRTNMICTMK
jgi:hypothetical protein